MFGAIFCNPSSSSSILSAVSFCNSRNHPKDFGLRASAPHFPLASRRLFVAMQRPAFQGRGGEVTPSLMFSPKKVGKYFYPDQKPSAEKLMLEPENVADEFKMSESDCGSSPVQGRRKATFYFVKSLKKVEVSRGPQKESKKKLSQILRTEAAVRGIEKKANSAKSSSLWPKAVLEALDDSIDSNQWESALKIFKLLRKQHWYHPKCQTYTKLLRMLGKCKQPEQASLLFQMMLCEGLKPTVDVYTSLVGVYGSSGLFQKAFSTIDQMKSVTDCKPDVYTYTVLITCCCKLRRFDLICRVLTEMSYLGIECNSVTYNTIIDGYGKAGMFELMENSLSSMIETGRYLPDVFTMNSFIWAYGNDGQIEQMEKWFEEFQHMGVKPDIKTFNALIKSYGKAGMYDKMGLVMKFMKKRFFSPTIVTFNIIIETFGKSGNIEKMEFYFQLMKSQGIKPNSVTYCSLVNSYSKARLLKKVHAVLRQIENSDVVLDTPFFNCIISVYGQAGVIRRVEEMVSLMKEKKCVPDKITFATMIQVYNEYGMLEAAYELEKQMSNMKGIIQEHG